MLKDLPKVDGEVTEENDDNHDEGTENDLEEEIEENDGKLKEEKIDSEEVDEK